MSEDKPPYNKVVTYHFEVCGEVFSVLGWSNDYVYLEETRKNGQEDCHTSAEFNKVDGAWVLDWDEEFGEPSIMQYFGERYLKGIIEHLTKHGPPES